MSSENPESMDLDLNSLQQAQLLPQFISILEIRISILEMLKKIQDKVQLEQGSTESTRSKIFFSICVDDKKTY